MRIIQKTKLDEKGSMALPMVIIISICMVTLLGTTYVYVVNRAKYHARVKKAYQIQNLMEQAAKRMRQNYDQSGDGRPSANECNGMTPPGDTTPNPTPPTGATGNGIVVRGPDGIKYCFAQNEDLTKKYGYIAFSGDFQDQLVLEDLNWDVATYKRFVAKLDAFFDDTQIFDSSSFEKSINLERVFQKPQVAGFIKFMDASTLQAKAGASPSPPSICPSAMNCTLNTADPESVKNCLCLDTSPMGGSMCMSNTNYHADMGAAIRAVVAYCGSAPDRSGCISGKCQMLGGTTCTQGGGYFRYAQPNPNPMNSMIVSECNRYADQVFANLDKAWTDGGMACPSPAPVCPVGATSPECVKWNLLKCLNCSGPTCAKIIVTISSRPDGQGGMIPLNVNQSFKFVVPGELQ